MLKSSKRASRAAVVQRRFTKEGADPLDGVKWVKASSSLTNPNGEVLALREGLEAPGDWSQLAVDIAAMKYFRRAGLYGDAGKGESSVRQLVHRLANTIRGAGEQWGYFRDGAEAGAFEAELSYMLVNQIGAFNSPVWFNCGLFQQYGIMGEGGNWAWNPALDHPVETENAYGRPQCSACFIQGVDDSLMSIFELVKNEARLFKYGSGTGSNFSALRGRQEKLSGGGTSSGLMSFLEVLDRAAGATKSGGTTRRAAKMVCLNVDHPEILDFVRWKSKEEKKAQALIAAGYPADFNGEAYHTVSGQNSNNSVRVTDEFMKAVEQDGTWETRARTTGAVCEAFPARSLWREIGEAAWACADPGVQYDSTINDWHTCPNSGRINASNPCSEYKFLDDTACNLSSLNLTKFLVEGADGSLRFDIEGYRHAARVFFLAQEILVDFSSYPTKAIAQNSHDYRPLGLGYANLGTLLMVLGIAYDSPEGRSMAAALTAILTGQAYRVSAEVAAHKGPFAGYARNREPMLRVMRKHRDAAYAIDAAACPADLFGAAKEDWDEAVRLGEQYGYRNAQATVLAPTGTIGLLMDCFDGDTLVAVADGRNAVSFRQLAEEGKDVDVYASDAGRTVVRRMTNIGLIREDSPMVRVTLDDGTFVRCTPDHRFMLRSGEYVAAVDLVEGDSLMRFDSVVSSETGAPRRKIWQGPNAGGNRSLGRSWKYQYRMTGARLFPGYAGRNGGLVHHENEDSLDDSYENLRWCKDISEHQRIHWSTKTAAERSAILKSHLSVLTAEQLRARSKKAHEAQSPEQRKARAQKAADAHTSAERSEWTTRGWAGIDEEARRERAAKGWATRRANALNHKVVSVVEDGRGDSYCGTVLGTGNFAIVTTADADAKTGDLSGVVVHNCDTTGIEPDFALVKFKKLAGGGYFKIVNASVERALGRLGYSKAQIAEILAYVVGTNTFLGAPVVNREYLKGKGFTNEDITRLEGQLPGAFTVEGVFSAFGLGADLCKRLGVEEAAKAPGWNLLAHWGLTRAQIDLLGDTLLGRMTVEGAPHLRDEHLPVFDCANRCGKHGTRYLKPMSHVQMMAAVQPFLSGAISKTVNLPNDATVEEVMDVYTQGWKLGLKAVALYRDGCKASQPLSTSGKDDKTEKEDKAQAEAEVRAAAAVDAPSAPPAAPVAVSARPTVRYRLPARRRGFTQEAKIGGHKVFLRTGEYGDGQLGEIFIDMHKEGAAFRSLMNSFAIAVSMGLQHGVPLQAYVDMFTFTRFEPQGSVVGHANVKYATSIIDYVFRALGVEYLKRYDLAHVLPEGDGDAPDPAPYAPYAPPAASEVSASNQHLGKMMGDAPMCDVCGHITVRNGTCYRCHNCGNSMGCS